jgi:hypothetical protein
MTVAKPIAGIKASSGHPQSNSYLCIDGLSRGEVSTVADSPPSACDARNQNVRNQNVRNQNVRNQNVNGES